MPRIDALIEEVRSHSEASGFHVGGMVAEAEQPPTSPSEAGSLTGTILGPHSSIEKTSEQALAALGTAERGRAERLSTYCPKMVEKPGVINTVRKRIGQSQRQTDGNGVKLGLAFPPEKVAEIADLNDTREKPKCVNHFGIAVIHTHTRP